MHGNNNYIRYFLPHNFRKNWAFDFVTSKFLPCTVFTRRAWVFPTFGTGKVLTQRLLAGNPGKMQLTSIASRHSRVFFPDKTGSP